MFTRIVFNILFFLLILVFPETQVIVDGAAYLKCDLGIPDPTSDDPITLIFWYRDDNSLKTKATPIYTVDSRDGPLELATHFPGESLRNRTTFTLTSRPAILKIDPVAEDDAGEYRCRVDFRYGRTLKSHITLSVIGKKIFFVLLWWLNELVCQLCGIALAKHSIYALLA